MTVVWGQHEFETTEWEHRELLETLSKITGTFQFSGYHSQLYDDFAARHGRRCAEYPIDNMASSAKQGEIKTECLRMSYE